MMHSPINIRFKPGVYILERLISIYIKAYELSIVGSEDY